MNEKVEDYIKQVVIPTRAIFQDMLKYAPSKLFGLFGNAIIIPIYTSLLSPSQYGVYTIALAVLSFLCVLFSDWVGLSGLRFFRINQINDELPKYLSTLIGLLTTNLLIMYILAFIFKNKFYEYFNISPKIFLFILILVIPVAIRALLFQVLRAQIKPWAFTVSTIINQLLTITIAVLLLKYTTLQAVSILIAMAISITIIDLLLAFQSNLFKLFQFEKPNKQMLKSMYIYGSPIAAASISMWIINQSNKFITTHYHGLNEAGFVGVAYNMTFPILMTIFAIITIAAVPRIINLYEDNIDVRPLISKLTGYFMIIAIPMVVFIAIYAPDLMTLFANSKYQNAYILLPYFAFGALFLSFAEYTTLQYHLANKTYILTILKVIAGILGLALNIVLIKNFGLIGVGIATLTSNAIYFLLSVLIKLPNLEWKVPFKVLGHIITSFIPTAGMYWILSIAEVNEIIQMPLILLFYYLVFYGLNRFFENKTLEL